MLLCFKKHFLPALKNGQEMIFLHWQLDQQPHTSLPKARDPLPLLPQAQLCRLLQLSFDNHLRAIINADEIWNTLSQYWTRVCPIELIDIWWPRTDGGSCAPMTACKWRVQSSRPLPSLVGQPSIVCAVWWAHSTGPRIQLDPSHSRWQLLSGEFSHLQESSFPLHTGTPCCRIKR